jgi:hypothetical protein
MCDEGAEKAIREGELMLCILFVGEVMKFPGELVYVV